eukprot:TRINITY_DN13470_c0_g1_i1.p1 TRINITY_DN13470_c0_g1~~TRINITY_DN13470_c0_g1_i1.p1  ORF type:complete len:120 (-),score=0.18 TRINITY_DN13470_c0_g1_i1:32-391(-)
MHTMGKTTDDLDDLMRASKSQMVEQMEVMLQDYLAQLTALHPTDGRIHELKAKIAGISAALVPKRKELDDMALRSASMGTLTAATPGGRYGENMDDSWSDESSTSSHVVLNDDALSADT